MPGNLSTNKENLTFGEWLADLCVEWLGSWTLVAGLTLFFAFWMCYNLFITHPLDPFPFILLNLFLSFLAAYGNPVIIMSARRQERIVRELDRYNLQLSERSDTTLLSILDLLKEERELNDRLLAFLEKHYGTNGK